MSELSSTRNDSQKFRWQLLATVSAVALLASFTMRDAKAADQDADRPTVWIELGGQLERVGGQGNSFAPGFLDDIPKFPRPSADYAAAGAKSPSLQFRRGW